MIVAEKKYYYNQPIIEEKLNEKNNKQKKIKPKSYRLEKVVIFATIFIILTASILLLLRYSKIIESRYTIHNLSRQLEQIEIQTQKTRIEVEKVMKSKYVETQAISRLNMKYPDLNQTLYINVDPIEVAEISNHIDEKFNNTPVEEVNSRPFLQLLSKLRM